MASTIRSKLLWKIVIEWQSNRYEFPIIIEHRTSGEIKETEYKPD